MSRREIIVNTLCGLLLIGTLATPFVLGFAMLHFVVKLTSPFLARYASLLGMPEGFWNAVFVSFLVIPATIQQFRRGYWLNVFLVLITWKAVLMWYESIQQSHTPESFPITGLLVLFECV